VLEIFRWMLFLEGLFVLGTLAALYERVWRFALPAAATRSIIVAGGATVGGYLMSLYDRVRAGPPLSWRDALAAAVLSVYLFGLVTLLVWYRRPPGRRQRHAAIANYNAERLLRAEAQRQRSEERERGRAG
jgi:hypothetical protein